MNPFDLRGPAFLVLYALVSAGGFFFMYLTARGVIFGPPRAASVGAHKNLRDPYLMAYLRGGYRHTLTTAVFSLYQRKLISGAGEAQLRATSSKDALAAVHNTLEHAVLRSLATPQRLHQVRDDKPLKNTVEAYVEPLRHSGLIADESEYRRRLPAFVLVGGTLFALAAIKFVLALTRGHSNVLFLIIFTLAAVFATWAIFNRRRTNAGDQALKNQQTLLARLKDRVHRLAADGATNEAVLIAATFGLDALPTDAYPFAQQLRKTIDAPSKSSGCGSSAGCGGSCGGGCGGGCGGCGS
jgi:uncharacterized protein (TIGR04222 family)